MLSLQQQVFFGISSERLLLEQLDYNKLSHWLVGKSTDDAL
jgi:hypothetical protein